MTWGKAWELNVLSGFDSTFLLSPLGSCSDDENPSTVQHAFPECKLAEDVQGGGGGISTLSPGLVCLKRKYPKGSDPENKPFTFRELSTPSLASPHHPAPFLVLSSQGPGFLRYWVVGTRDAPGIKTMKWKILISCTYQ